MGFLGFGRNPLKDADPEVRQSALHQVAEDRQDLFERLALEDSAPQVRAVAAGRVRRSDALQRLMDKGDDAVKRIARERLSTVAGKLARDAKVKPGSNLLDAVTDRSSLADLCVHAKESTVRADAWGKLKALPDVPEPVWEAVAVQDPDGAFGVEAIGRLDTRSILKRVIKKAKTESVKLAAEQRLAALAQVEATVSADARRIERVKALEPLAARAARLSVTLNGARDAAGWAALAAERAAIAQRYDGLGIDEPARRLLDRIEQTERSAAKMIEEADAADAATVAARRSFLDDLAKAEPSAPGAGGARARELGARWAAVAAGPIGNGLQAEFAALVEKLCPPAGPVVHVEAVVPAGLVELNAEAEATAARTDFKDAALAFQLLHKRWMMLAGDLPPGHVERERFVRAYQDFKQRRAETRGERNVIRENRREERTACLTEARRLAEAAAEIGPEASLDVVDRHGREVHQLVEHWRSLGPASAPERQLREQYQEAIDAAHAPLRARREAAEWERFAHQSKAEELITLVDALAANEDLAEVANAVKQQQSAWKKLGPLPRDTAQATWERFHAACEREYARCQPYFAEQERIRTENLALARSIIAEVEKLTAAPTVGLTGSVADRTARRNASERVKQLQADWRAGGQVPRGEEDALWTAWRAALDAFWGKNREFQAADAAVREANLKNKLELIASAERLADDSERSKAAGAGLITPADVSRRVRELQRQWKEVGHVPMEQVEPTWQKFKTACDRAFATIKDHLDAQDAEREANLQTRLAIIAELEEILGNENPRWHIDDVTRLKERWRNVGRVGRDHVETTERRFRDALARFDAVRS